MNPLVTAVCCSLLVATSVDAQTATLKMRFVFDGVPPPIQRIAVVPALAPPGGPLINERLLVDPETKGIKNFVVYLFTGRGGSKLDPIPSDEKVRLLTMANQRFEPHILITRAGDTLKLVDRGPNQHSAVLHFFANSAQSFVPPRGQAQSVKLHKPEPAPIPIDCNIHPWMRAYLIVLDHPYVAVSDSQGNLSIEGLSENTNLTFRVWHEAGYSFKRLTIAGSEVELTRNLFKVDLTPGVNDLGDILIPASAMNP